jgi:hypothetical protein
MSYLNPKSTSFSTVICELLVAQQLTIDQVKRILYIITEHVCHGTLIWHMIKETKQLCLKQLTTVEHIFVLQAIYTSPCYRQN